MNDNLFATLFSFWSCWGTVPYATNSIVKLFISLSKMRLSPLITHE
mgnify:CR=1 FL=1